MPHSTPAISHRRKFVPCVSSQPSSISLRTTTSLSHCLYMSVIPHSPIADHSSLSHRQPSGSFLTLPPPAIRAWSRGTKKGKIMAGVSMEKFEEYFQKADVDRDGRISGAEAVAFLQVSNLHRQVLAQIWMNADQNRIGFLSRPEFYNALGLVIVSQSKRELKPDDIVKAAFYGHASAKITPPTK